VKQQQSLLNISVIGLVSYTSLMVGIAEGRPLPYVFTLPVALAALGVSLRWPHRQIQPFSAFILGLIAFALAFVELMTGSIEVRLTGGAHLSTYLCWILLLTRKRLPEYWWLFALCTTQVAIGAVLLDSVVYGGFLMGYLLFGLWNLALFSLYRAQHRFAVEGSDGAQGTEGNDRQHDQQQQQLAPPAAAARSLRQPSSAAGAIHTHAGERWLLPRFVGGVFGMGLGSLVVAAVFFLLIPRFWVGNRTWGLDRSDNDEGVQTLSGFSEKVSLGSYGTILESNETVLEVRLFDENNQPLSVEEYATRLGHNEPLFRGHVLDVYDRGSWSPSANWFYDAHTVSDSRSPGSVRQVFRLRPTGSRFLFAMRPMPLRPVLGGRLKGRNEGLSYEPRSGVLSANGGSGSPGALRYELYTRAKPPRGRSRGAQFPLQANRSLTTESLEQQLREFLQTDIGMPPRDIPRDQRRQDLRAFAAQERRRANLIVQFLRDSNEFTYTLRIAPRRSRELDPVMEFLTERRSGHCEYFATALALLLRADDIPSRLVCGFKGGEPNTLTGYFEVQQRHAHAWVEAYIGGQWVTLDATPAADRALSVESVGGFWQSWRNFRQFVRHVWSSFVVEMDYSQQRSQLYHPLQETAKDAWSSVSAERRGTAAGLRALWEFLSHPSRWFSWQGGLLSLCLMLFAASLVWAVKRLWALFSRFRGFWISPESRFGKRVDFYERFRRICEAAGFVRPAHQTQQEFAAVVTQRLAEQHTPETTRHIPQALTATFYDVRFGAAELPPERERQVDEQLTQMQQAFENQRQNGNGMA